MPCSAKDIQLIEFKDTILQLNELIRTKTQTMETLRFLQREVKDAFSGQIGLFDAEGDDRVSEIIVSEEIKVSAHKRSRKLKAAYEEQFGSLLGRRVPLDSLRGGEKICPVCGETMTLIGTEVVCTELDYYPAVLDKVEYTAAIYACPSCKVIA